MQQNVLSLQMQRWPQWLLAFVWTLLAFPIALQAQSPPSDSAHQQLRGRFINSRTGEPMPFVFVESREMHVLVQSDAEGRFVMDLPIGQHHDTLGLELTRSDMEPRRALVNLETAVAVTEVTIALDFWYVFTIVKEPNHCGCTFPDILPLDLTPLLLQAPKVKYVRNPEISPTVSGWHIEY